MLLVFGALVTFGIAAFAIHKKKIEKKLQDFRDLNSLVATRYNSQPKIFLVSCQMVGQMYWRNILGYFKEVENIEKGKIKFSYIYQGKTYHIVTKPKKGPKLIEKVIDENDTDVTEEIIPYMGINSDWHKEEYMPEFWKKKSLYFFYTDGRMKVFGEKEVIKI